jgi:ribosome-binding ATPase
MGLEIGIVGLPNSGKSTLFNALTNAGSMVASYPFTTIDPHVGIADVPDERLTAIARIIKPQKVVPAAIKFVDIAGLVKGAHQGEGLGNQFLAQIREVDALAIVLRCFNDENVPHVSGQLDPLDDLAVLDVEMGLADLGSVERRLQKDKIQAKANPRQYTADIEVLEQLMAHLEKGDKARTFKTDAAGDEIVKSLFLLTTKTRILVANIGEEDLPQGGLLAGQISRKAAEEGGEAIAICAELEAGLADFSADEAREYLAELGVAASGLERFISAGYRLLDLISFITVTGGEVARAWTLRRGKTVLAASGEIHSDMERGFIRADVVAAPELIKAGSLAALREMGKLHSEGREYVVADGDVLHIHFKV